MDQSDYSICHLLVRLFNCTLYNNKKHPKRLLYINKATHFSKSKTICVKFLFKKRQTIYVRRFFMKFFVIGIYIYTKRMILCIKSRFYVQKYRHFEKSKTICVTLLHIKKAWHFALRNFSQNFWNWWRGGVFLCLKTMHFDLHFYMQNTMQFLLSFYIPKARHFV